MIELKPLPFEEAIEVFRGLVPMTADEFYALAQEARAAAFTVTGVMRMDVLVDMHGAVEKAISEGETLADFRNRIDDIFEARGWTAPPDLAPYRLETVFRNNVQTAYNTGRYNQMVDQKDAFPAWEYDAVNDADTRPEHAAQDGKIYPVDHPYWDTWYPPNGHRCRCGVNPVHKQELEGVKTESDMPPEKPDQGWDHNPARQRWQPDLSKYPPELREQFQPQINAD